MNRELSYKETTINNLFLISAKFSVDQRGYFTKHYQQSALKAIFEKPFVESYYSVSVKGAIRGMHYQAPPYAHIKLVVVPKGSITDVVVDLRGNSATYGRYETFDLNEKNRLGLLIPEGLAHGFLSREDNTIVFYQQSSEYHPESDKGILWNSFGYDWRITNPVISERDKSFMQFSEYDRYYRKPFKDD